jgi:hypothetical protein
LVCPSVCSLCVGLTSLGIIFVSFPYGAGDGSCPVCVSLVCLISTLGRERRCYIGRVAYSGLPIYLRDLKRLPRQDA